MRASHLRRATLSASEFLGFEGGARARALVVLNSPDLARIPLGLLRHVWRISSYRVFADGAANRVHDVLASSEREELIPDCVCGDFDSLRSDVRTFYERRGTTVEHAPSQNATDLMKCIHAVERSVAAPFDDDVAVAAARPPRPQAYASVLILGAFGGRFDHEMQNVNTLFTCTSSPELGRVVLLDATCWAALLQGSDTTHTVVPRRGGAETLGAEVGTCGLVPVGRPCADVTTTGLRWNLDGSPLAFGGMVSTSNELDGDCATVAMRSSDDGDGDGDDAALLWTSVFRDDAWSET